MNNAGSHCNTKGCSDINLSNNRRPARQKFVSDLFLSSFRGLPHRGGFRLKYSLSFARCNLPAGGLTRRARPHEREEISDETHAVCHCDCPSTVGWCHSDRARRRMCGWCRSRRLCRSQRGRRRRTTRGSGRRNERNAYESWCDRHRCARQHRDQSSGARVCFRKWPAGLPLTL
jgi:hypothetical protein